MIASPHRPQSFHLRRRPREARRDEIVQKMRKIICEAGSPSYLQDWMSRPLTYFKKIWIHYWQLLTSGISACDLSSSSIERQCFSTTPISLFTYRFLSTLNPGSKGNIYMRKVCFREQSMPIVKLFRQTLRG